MTRPSFASHTSGTLIGTDLDAAGHPAGLVGAERRGEQGRLGGEGDALLRGDIDVLAEAGVEAIVVGDERGAGGVGTGVQIGLRHAHAQGRTVVVAGEDEDAARGHHDQVAVGIGRFGTVLAERRNRNIDQRGINRGEVGYSRDHVSRDRRGSPTQ